jgi:Peptidase inhibitor I78 family
MTIHQCGVCVMWKMLMVILFGAFGAPVLAAGDDNGLTACGADQVQDLIGQPVDESRDRLAPEARIIPPNSPITQDYRPDRLNVDLDKDGIITRIWCG